MISSSPLPQAGVPQARTFAASEAAPASPSRHPEQRKAHAAHNPFFSGQTYGDFRTGYAGGFDPEEDIVDFQPPRKTNLREGEIDPQSVRLTPWNVQGVALGYKGPDSRPLPLHKGFIEDGTNINHWPAYAIAPLDHALQTSGLHSCSALSIIGPDRHYLLHLNRVGAVEYVIDHLKEDIPWDLSQSKIAILPGIDEGSQKTSRLILEALDAVKPGLASRAQFLHYPAEAAEYGETSYWTTSRGRMAVSETVSLISHNGRLYYKPLKLKPGGVAMRKALGTKNG